MAALLVGIDKAMIRLGMNPELIQEVAQALEAAITAAQVRLETELDSRVSKGSGQALFALNKDYFSGVQPDGYFRLLLDQGFLRAGSPSEVGFVESWGGPVTSPVPTKDWHVDRDRGVIYVSEAHAGKLVRVSYTSGFASEQEVASLNPWIQEAILAYTPLVLNTGRDSEGGNTTAGSWRLSGDLAQAIVARYSRKIGFTLRPVLSSWALDPS